METLAVEGPTPLRGEIEVAGAKNSVSKLLTASMLTAEPCRFSNVPAIGDMEITKRICQALGAHCTEGAAKQLDVQTPRISVAAVPESLAVKNRLSVMMLAPLLHRHGRAVVPAAGGDRIGPRPVDFHLEGYRRMGARVETLDDVYYLESDGLKGADIALPYPSVTATENLLMAATLARGRTFIRNAAIEPEVVDLALFLQKMGAIIDYQADRTFIVEGVSTLGGATHDVMPDRLVAASLGAAAIASHGDLFVRGARQSDMLTFLNALRRIGGGFEVQSDGIRFYRDGALRSIAVETTVHPGFMTDWQPPFALLLTQADGMSVVHETVFEDRFVYVHELQKMGADIEIYDTCLGGQTCRFAASGHRHSAVIRGPVTLKGAEIDIPDLRAGFTYLIAAILASGRSVIRGVEELDRGYEQIDESLRALGAQIERIDA
jgi:UDP-N-acetylglucosamine 1-carboxyvinyltransferase